MRLSIVHIPFFQSRRKITTSIFVTPRNKDSAVFSFAKGKLSSMVILTVVISSCLFFRKYSTNFINSTKKTPSLYPSKGVLYILAATYSPTNAVPSALTGLTSLFGMGRGGALSLKPPESFRV